MKKLNFKVSIIVIHLGKDELLINFLNSLYKNFISYPFDVIVIDNHSQMSTIDDLVNKYQNCRLIKTNKKVGYAEATNLGIKNSRSEYILWCNNDLLFTQNAINLLISFLDFNMNYAIAGPQLLNFDGSKQESGSHIDINLFSLFLEKLHIIKILKFFYNLLHNKKENPFRVKITTGACCLIRRNSLEKIGGLIDERFYMYCEEFDLSRMLRKKGFNIAVIPKSKIIHLGGQTTSGTSINYLIQSYKSKFSYIKKHYGKISINLFSLFISLFSVLYLIIYFTLIAILYIFNRKKTFFLKQKLFLNFYLLKLSLTKEKFNSRNLVFYYGQNN
jgi:N-acetylglucosaminyl-diphospho-decaprenol L-rhamnosyltransferase